MIRRYLILLALMPAALFGAAQIEFTGVMVYDSGKIHVFLVNKDTSDSKLIPVGGKFGGYIVEACNNPTSTKPEIVLASATNRAAKQTLRLKQVSIGVSAPSPTPVNATLGAPALSGVSVPAQGLSADSTAAISAALDQARAEALIRAQAQAAAAAATPPPPPATAPEQ